LQDAVKNKKTFFINLEKTKYKTLLDEDPENIFTIS
jgi:hypothetical protein